ncbi:expressed unknown protein [Seminavis robusta]|uniref:Sulfotransferase n=1 Tax=Seminavis robusta TaxID=568900 RepID=A0A9N8HEZ3_9STRA|nr:expressed unknown protein [Seminavis robusta]|eukprot:Sro408_g136880.1 n/a (357) ;mRNA; r:21634-22704
MQKGHAGPITDNNTLTTRSDNSNGGSMKESKSFRSNFVLHLGILLMLGAMAFAAGVRRSSPMQADVKPKEVVFDDKTSFIAPKVRISQNRTRNRSNPHGYPGSLVIRERLEKRKQEEARKAKKPHRQHPEATGDVPSSMNEQLKVPYPIFVLNLPKSGTTTLWQYFECGLGPNRAVHWWTTQKGKQIGPCVEHNIKQNKPPVQNCGTFDVWIDFGYAGPDKCFFPAVHALEALYKSYPDATFLLVRRDTESWYQSAKKWGKMFEKWKTACRKDFFPNLAATQPVHTEDFRTFYETTTLRIRQFAKENPGMRYLEPNMTLSSPALGGWLEENIGIEASCWGKCKPNGHKARCEGRFR